jgi:hypothetical protein
MRYKRLILKRKQPRKYRIFSFECDNLEAYKQFRRKLSGLRLLFFWSLGKAAGAPRRHTRMSERDLKH